MAAYDACDGSNTEIEAQTHSVSMDLSDFVSKCVFPQCVSVTQGNFLSSNVQISVGDVLLLKSCDGGQVTLCYKNDTENNLVWTEVSVGLDYSQKFNVLPPKETNAESRVVSMVMYPTISDLMLDCPTYFEATTSYDDTYLPDMSVNVGDRFWFVGIVRNSKDGLDRLKVRNESGSILFLSLECRGNFCPLKDDNEYTIKQLVDFASVSRRLKMVNKEPNARDSIDRTVTEPESKHTIDEYAVVHKTTNKSHVSIPPSTPSSKDRTVTTIPESFYGIIHLQKYESAVTVSPYNDPETNWTVPVSANLKVRTYSQDDYEVPAPRSQLFKTRVPLPLSLTDEVPKFRAPSSPSLQPPLVPITITNFIDIYCSRFPVKAKILNMTEAHPFFQERLKNTEDVIVYRLDEARRLYVKDLKSDTVYSLSHDLKLSFIEYPEKFKKVAELLHLPIGTDVTVLEDIAADFPKTISLRLGDVIRITSNTPYFIKMKHSSRDCQVIKCERIDSGSGDSTKLKLPMDFEVSMVMTVDHNSRRVIPLQDLLAGTVPIPNQSVASVPDATEDAVLKELPVNLRILKSLKETCIVVASSALAESSSTSDMKTAISSNSSACFDDKTAQHCSRQEQASLRNIGLPLTSGIVLALRDKLDLFDLDVRESEADYIRLPVEKMTLTQFEERECMRKLNSDYEDIEFGSNSTLDESGACSNSISRASSTGMLDKKQKNSAKEKVLRLSRALNPKHWRHSKAEPEPLPHPSAMGLMTLAARPKEEISNEYHHTQLDSASVKSGSIATSVSSEEDENFYEDVEIGPIRSSTIPTTPVRKTGAFSGPSHRSLPPRMPSISLARSSMGREVSDIAEHPDSELSELPTYKASTSFETHAYDVPKPHIRAKNWAVSIGNSIGERFSTKPQYDIPKSNMTKEEKEQTAKTTLVTTPVNKGLPDRKPPMPPPKTNTKALDLAEKTDTGSLPIPPTRRKGRRISSQISDLTKSDSEKAEQDLKQQGISKSISLNDSLSVVSERIDLPKPKPRGLKSMMSEEASPNIQKPVLKSRSADAVKSKEVLSGDALPSTVGSKASPYLASENKPRPKPPPKPKVSVHTTV